MSMRPGMGGIKKIKKKATTRLGKLTAESFFEIEAPATVSSRSRLIDVIAPSTLPIQLQFDEDIREEDLAQSFVLQLEELKEALSISQVRRVESCSLEISLANGSRSSELIMTASAARLTSIRVSFSVNGKGYIDISQDVLRALAKTWAKRFPLVFAAAWQNRLLEDLKHVDSISDSLQLLLGNSKTFSRHFEAAKEDLFASMEMGDWRQSMKRSVLTFARHSLKPEPITFPPNTTP
ncbi:hypothetical protein BT69DRAFT_1339863 [Atractiella rhizophila]|nr:hypothetical protein BT69DRAFT_1339863 [Atractiella rhizophila]